MVKPVETLSYGDRLIAQNGLSVASKAKSNLHARWPIANTRTQIIASAVDPIGGSSGLGGWSVSGGSLTTDASNPARPGVPSFKVTGSPGATVTVRRRIYGVALTGKFAIHHYMPRASSGTPAQIYFQWSATTPGADPPTGSPANSRQIYIANGGRANDCWTVTTVHPASNHFEGGGASTGRAWYSTEALPSTVQYIDMAIVFNNDQPSADCVFWFDEIGINGKTTPPFVMVGFDGFYASQASIALPVFQKYGFQGYGSSAGFEIAGNLSTVQSLSAAGWDIISQAQRGGDASPNGYATGYASLAADDATARAQFRASSLGLNCEDIFTYPYGARSAGSDGVLRSLGYKLARAASQAGNDLQSFGGCDLLTLSSATLDQRSATDLQALLDAAILAGEDVWFTGHNLTNTAVGSATSIETNITEFKTFMAYLATKHAAGNITVVKPSEYRDYFVA